jgi:Mn-dependent DtxR family transcriptional regulator
MRVTNAESLLGVAAEDYLKAVLLLSQRTPKVMLSSVAEHLGVSSAAVSKMIRRLRRRGLANHSRGGGLRPSPSGARRSAGAAQAPPVGVIPYQMGAGHI